MRLLILLPLLGMALAGCGGSGGGTEERLVISPKLATVAKDAVTNFTFTYSTSGDGGVVWSTNGGSVTQTGAYRGPKFDGLFEVTVASTSKPGVFDKALVAVGNENGGSITPETLSLGTGESATLTASFVDVTDEAADWFSTGGEVTRASDTTATFKAPSTPGTITVVARSRQNPFLFDKLSVSVQNIVVTVTPDGASVAPGSSQSFSAEVLGASLKEVTWEATGGSITPAGVWTAPSSTGVFVITARSKANPSAFGSATIVVR